MEKIMFYTRVNGIPQFQNVAVKIAGPFTLKVCPGVLDIGEHTVTVDRAVDIHVPAPEVFHVRDEEYPKLVEFDEKAWGGWMRGTRLRGLITEECSAPGLLIPGTVRVKPSRGSVKPFVLDRDYRLESFWATVGRTPESSIKYDQTVYIDYDYVPCRLDSIVVNQAGDVRLVTGRPGVGAMMPPKLKKGEVTFANLWFQGPTAKITPENLYPIEPEKDLEPDNQKQASKTLLPKTLGKIRQSKPLTILAWGDSVTCYNMYQTMFVDLLKERFPDVKINLITVAWGGHRSEDFLNASPGDSYNFQEKCIQPSPDLVTVEFVNDADAYLDEGEVIKRYGLIIDKFRAIGTEVVLITPHFIRSDRMGKNTMKFDDDPRPYVKGLRKTASKYRVALADSSKLWGQLWRQGIPYITLLSNSINHPDKRGHQLYAKALMSLFPNK